MNGPPRPVTTAREWAARAGIIPWYAGGRAFSPRSLPNLGLWLDASSAGTITLNGSDVSAWADKSGNGRDFSRGTAAQQPEYVPNAHNGRAALRFTGAESLIGNAPARDLLRNLAATTTYAVCLTTDHNTSGFLFWAATQNFGQARFGLAVSATNNDHLVSYRRLDGDSGHAYRTQVLWPENQLVIIGVHHDWASQVGRIYEDGVLLEDAALTTTAGSTSDTASNAIVVGGDSSGTRWRGDICELLVYQDTHTTEEREQVQDYLAGKWGITL